MDEANHRVSSEKVSPGLVKDDNSLESAVLHDEASGEIVNASGHKDQLHRGYGLLSVCGLALSIDNAWVAMGTSLQVAIANGGPPGILYEFLTASFYYAFIGASIAELASAIPSSGGVYHWATVAPGPRWGRVIGYYAGWINFFGWLFGLSSIIYIMAELLVQMYTLYHPAHQVTQWNLFVTFAIYLWLCNSITIFFNRFLPPLQQFGMFMVIVGGIVTIIVVVAMTPTRASTAFVWTDWQNVTGWNSGVAFLTGVLNGAFTIGTVDAVTHVAEELPNPRRDLPRAVAAQLGLGSIYAFCFGIAILYGINDLSAVAGADVSFPLAVIYQQATGSTGATFGLLFIIFLTLTPGIIGTLLTAQRTWFALARDDAVPFASFFAKVSIELSCPIPAAILVGVIITGLGAITLGSATAFIDLAGSFAILTTVSYALAIAPHVLTGRSNIRPGTFWMGRLGYPINILSVVFIIFFDIMYCFPYGLPTSVASMNYNSVILVGVCAVATVWWVAYASRNYKPPKVQMLVLESEVRRLSKV